MLITLFYSLFLGFCGWFCFGFVLSVWWLFSGFGLGAVWVGVEVFGWVFVGCLWFGLGFVGSGVGFWFWIFSGLIISFWVCVVGL